MRKGTGGKARGKGKGRSPVLSQRRGNLAYFCQQKKHPLLKVQYRDDLTGQMVERIRCATCAISYLPGEA